VVVYGHVLTPNEVNALGATPASAPASKIEQAQSPDIYRFRFDLLDARSFTPRESNTLQSAASSLPVDDSNFEPVMLLPDAKIRISGTHRAISTNQAIISTSTFDLYSSTVSAASRGPRTLRCDENGVPFACDEKGAPAPFSQPSASNIEHVALSSLQYSAADQARGVRSYVAFGAGADIKIDPVLLPPCDAM
jgi:hypothetical protein